MRGGGVGGRVGTVVGGGGEGQERNNRNSSRREGVGRREGEVEGGRLFLTLLSTRYSTCLNTIPFFSGIRVTAISSIDFSSSYVYPSWFGCVARNNLMQESRISAMVASFGEGSSVQEKALAAGL